MKRGTSTRTDSSQIAEPGGDRVTCTRTDSTQAAEDELVTRFGRKRNASTLVGLAFKWQGFKRLIVRDSVSRKTRRKESDRLSSSGWGIHHTNRQLAKGRASLPLTCGLPNPLVEQPHQEDRSFLITNAGTHLKEDRAGALTTREKEPDSSVSGGTWWHRFNTRTCLRLVKHW
jgi:hypothetical protein